MSEIDERIVRMRFDNEGFEKGIGDTIESIQKLNTSIDELSSTSANNVFSTLQSSLSKVDFTAFNQALDTINYRFSEMGVASAKIIEDIVEQVEGLAGRITKALTIEPVSLGWSEYNQLTDISKVIKYNTKASLDEINAFTDSLNAYADKTIYKFSEMEQIAKQMITTTGSLEYTFTTGDAVEIEKLVEGLSNFVGVTGGGNAQLTSLGLQIPRLLGGAKMTQQVANIFMRNGGIGKIFQDTLKQAAYNVGQGEQMEMAIATAGGFLNSFSKQEAKAYSGWANKDVWAEFLRMFADYETPLGMRALSASSDPVTFQQMMDQTWEALQTGWTRTWRTIIGDVDEARELWGKWNFILNGSDGVLSNYSNKIGEFFELWKSLGGREDVIDSLFNAFEGLTNIITSAGEAIKIVFPFIDSFDFKTLTEQLEETTESFRKWTEHLRGFFGPFVGGYDFWMEHFTETSEPETEKVAPDNDALVEEALKRISSEYDHELTMFFRTFKDPSFFKTVKAKDGSYTYELDDTKVSKYIRDLGWIAGSTDSIGKQASTIAEYLATGNEELLRVFYKDGIMNQEYFDQEAYDNAMLQMYLGILKENGIDGNSILNDISDELSTIKEKEPETESWDESRHSPRVVLANGKYLNLDNPDDPFNDTDRYDNAANLLKIVVGILKGIRLVYDTGMSLYKNVIEPIGTAMVKYFTSSSLAILAHIFDNVSRLYNYVRDTGVVDTFFQKIYAWLYNHIDIKDFFESLTEVAIEFIDMITNAAIGVHNFFTGVTKSSTFQILHTYLGIAIELISSLISGKARTGAVMGGLLGALKGAITGLFKGGLFGMITGAIKGLFSGGLKGGMAGNLLNWIQYILNNKDKVLTLLSSVWKYVKSIFSIGSLKLQAFFGGKDTPIGGMIYGIRELFSALTSKNPLEAITSFFEGDGWNNIKDPIVNTGKKIWETIVSIKDAIKDLWDTEKNGDLTFFEKVFGTIEVILSKFENALFGDKTGDFGNTKQMLSSLLFSIPLMIISLLKETSGTISNNLSDWWAKLLEDNDNDAGKAAKAFAKSLVEKVKNFFTGIPEFFTSVRDYWEKQWEASGHSPIKMLVDGIMGSDAVAEIRSAGEKISKEFNELFDKLFTPGEDQESGFYMFGDDWDISIMNAKDMTPFEYFISTLNTFLGNVMAELEKIPIIGSLLSSFVGLAQIITTAFSLLAHSIGEGWRGILELNNGDPEKAKQYIKDSVIGFFKDLWESFKNLIGLNPPTEEDPEGGFLYNLIEKVKWVIDKIAGLIDFIKESKVLDALKALKDTIGSVLNSFLTGLNGTEEGTESATLVNNLSTLFENIINKITEFNGSEAFTKLNNFAQWVGETLPKAGTGIVDFASKISEASQLLSSGEEVNLAEMFGTTLFGTEENPSFISGAIDSVTGFFDGIVESINAGKTEATEAGETAVSEIEQIAEDVTESGGFISSLFNSIFGKRTERKEVESTVRKAKDDAAKMQVQTFTVSLNGGESSGETVEPGIDNIKENAEKTAEGMRDAAGAINEEVTGVEDAEEHIPIYMRVINGLGGLFKLLVGVGAFTGGLGVVGVVLGIILMLKGVLSIGSLLGSISAFFMTRSLINIIKTMGIIIAAIAGLALVIDHVKPESITQAQLIVYAVSLALLGLSFAMMALNGGGGANGGDIMIDAVADSIRMFVSRFSIFLIVVGSLIAVFFIAGRVAALAQSSTDQIKAAQDAFTSIFKWLAILMGVLIVATVIAAKVLSFGETDKNIFAKAGIAVGAIIAGLAILIFAMTSLVDTFTKSGKGKNATFNWGAAITVIIGMVAGIAAMGVVTYMLIKSLSGMTGFTDSGFKIAAIAATILATAAGMYIISQALSDYIGSLVDFRKKLIDNGDDPEKLNDMLLKAALSIGGLLLAMGLAIKIITFNFSKKGGFSFGTGKTDITIRSIAAILAMTFAVKIIVGALTSLISYLIKDAKKDPDASVHKMDVLAGSIAAVVALMVSLGASIAFMKGDPVPLRSIIALLVLIGGVYLIIGALRSMLEIVNEFETLEDWGKATVAFGAIIGIMWVLSSFVDKLGTLKPDENNAWAPVVALLVMVGGMLLAIITIHDMLRDLKGKENNYDVAAIFASLAGMLLALALSVRLLNKHDWTSLMPNKGTSWGDIGKILTEVAGFFATVLGFLYLFVNGLDTNKLEQLDNIKFAIVLIIAALGGILIAINQFGDVKGISWGDIGKILTEFSVLLAAITLSLFVIGKLLTVEEISKLNDILAPMWSLAGILAGLSLIAAWIGKTVGNGSGFNLAIKGLQVIVTTAGVIFGILGILGGLYNASDGLIHDFMTRGGEGIETAIEFIGGLVKKFKEASFFDDAEVLNEGAAAVSTSVEAISNAGASIDLNNTGKVITILNEFAKIRDAVASVSMPGDVSAFNILEVFGTDISSLAEKMTEYMGYLSTISTALNGNGEDIEPFDSEKLTSILTMLAGFTLPEGSKVLSGWDSGRLKTQLENLTGALASFLEIAPDLEASDAFNYLLSIGENFISIFSGDAAEAYGYVYQAAEKLYGLIVFIIENLLLTEVPEERLAALDYLSSFIGGLAVIFEQAAALSPDELEDLIESIQTAIKGIFSIDNIVDENSIYKLVGFIISGFSKAFLEREEEIKNLAKTFGTWFAEGFAETLEISSPSRVFEDFGIWIILGLFKGIKSKEQIIKDKITSLASWVSDAFGKLLDKLGLKGVYIRKGITELVKGASNTLNTFKEKYGYKPNEKKKLSDFEEKSKNKDYRTLNKVVNRSSKDEEENTNALDTSTNAIEEVTNTIEDATNSLEEALEAEVQAISEQTEQTTQALSEEGGKDTEEYDSFLQGINTELENVSNELSSAKDDIANSWSGIIGDSPFGSILDFLTGASSSSENGDNGMQSPDLSAWFNGEGSILDNIKASMGESAETKGVFDYLAGIFTGEGITFDKDTLSGFGLDTTKITSFFENDFLSSFMDKTGLSNIISKDTLSSLIKGSETSDSLISSIMSIAESNGISLSSDDIMGMFQGLADSGNTMLGDSKSSDILNQLNGLFNIDTSEFEGLLGGAEISLDGLISSVDGAGSSLDGFNAYLNGLDTNLVDLLASGDLEALSSAANSFIQDNGLDYNQASDLLDKIDRLSQVSQNSDIVEVLQSQEYNKEELTRAQYELQKRAADKLLYGVIKGGGTPNVELLPGYDNLINSLLSMYIRSGLTKEEASERISTQIDQLRKSLYHTNKYTYEVNNTGEKVLGIFDEGVKAFEGTDEHLDKLIKGLRDSIQNDGTVNTSTIKKALIENGKRLGPDVQAKTLNMVRSLYQEMFYGKGSDLFNGDVLNRNKALNLLNESFNALSEGKYDETYDLLEYSLAAYSKAIDYGAKKDAPNNIITIVEELDESIHEERDFISDEIEGIVEELEDDSLLAFVKTFVNYANETRTKTDTVNKALEDISELTKGGTEYDYEKTSGVIDILRGIVESSDQEAHAELLPIFKETAKKLIGLYNGEDVEDYKKTIDTFYFQAKNGIKEGIKADTQEGLNGLLDTFSELSGLLANEYYQGKIDNTTSRAMSEGNNLLDALKEAELKTYKHNDLIDQLTQILSAESFTAESYYEIQKIIGDMITGGDVTDLKLVHKSLVGTLEEYAKTYSIDKDSALYTVINDALVEGYQAITDKDFTKAQSYLQLAFARINDLTEANPNLKELEHQPRKVVEETTDYKAIASRQLAETLIPEIKQLVDSGRYIEAYNKLSGSIEHLLPYLMESGNYDEFRRSMERANSGIEESSRYKQAKGVIEAVALIEQPIQELKGITEDSFKTVVQLIDENGKATNLNAKGEDVDELLDKYNPYYNSDVANSILAPMFAVLSDELRTAAFGKFDMANYNNWKEWQAPENNPFKILDDKLKEIEEAEAAHPNRPPYSQFSPVLDFDEFRQKLNESELSTTISNINLNSIENADKINSAVDRTSSNIANKQDETTKAIVGLQSIIETYIENNKDVKDLLLENLNKDAGVYLDGKKLVGALSSELNKDLYSRDRSKKRGVK